VQEVGRLRHMGACSRYGRTTVDYARDLTMLEGELVGSAAMPAA